MISLNSHLRVIIKNTLISLEIQLFGFINLNIHFFTKNSLERAEQHLIKCCHFEVGNLIVLQTIGISTDIAPFCANLNLSKHECDFMDNLIKEDIECYWFLKSNKWVLQIVPFKSIVLSKFRKVLFRSFQYYMLNVAYQMKQ